MKVENSLLVSRDSHHMELPNLCFQKRVTIHVLSRVRSCILYCIVLSSWDLHITNSASTKEGLSFKQGGIKNGWKAAVRNKDMYMNTWAHTETRSHTHTDTHIHTCTFTCTHTHSHTHSNSHSHDHQPILTYFHTHNHKHKLTYIHTHSHNHKHKLSHTHKLTHTHIHTLTQYTPTH